MLIHSFGTQHVVRTVIRLEQALHDCLTELTSTPGFAFGDDPKPVYALEDRLEDVSSRVEHLQHVLDTSRTSFDTQLAYRAARERIRRAHEFVIEVRILDQGSVRFTRKLIQMLTECLEYLQLFCAQYAPSELVDRKASIGD